MADNPHSVNLPLTLDLRTAAAAMGMSLRTAYRVAVPDGELCAGVPILRVGGRYRVPTEPLRRTLGMTEAELLRFTDPDT